MIDSIIEILFEEDYSKKVIIYVGGFKPPTKGHFEVVKNALEDFSDADELIIYVGGGVRDNITQEESIKIWDIYKKYLSPKVKIEPSFSPIKSVFDYAKQNPEEEIYWVLGAREGNEGDLADIENRTKSLDKYPNIVLKIITTPGGVSGTKARQALKLKDKEQFFELIPDIEEKEQIWDMVSPIVKEEEIIEVITDTDIICDNCGWDWKIADGGDDLYVCHKCGHDNNPDLEEASDPQAGTALPYGSGFAPVKEKSDPFGLNEYAKTFVKEVFKETSDLKESILSLSKYMLKNGLNIKPLPKVKFINNDEENASKILSKTAHYNPADKSITLYTFGRHPKDILRSFSHEMIHHMQNLEGRLNNIITTNTNEDGDLPELEREAYEKGNMMLRNWEDSIKNPINEWVIDIPKYNYTPKLPNKLFSQIYELKINEINLNPDNAVKINGDLFGGDFKVGDIEYVFSIKNIQNPYNDLGLFYNIQFDEKYNDKSSNEPTGNAKENYIKILSTMYKIILDFAEKEKPKYIGISSLDKSGYRNIYNNLSKTNNIPNYLRKDAGLEFTSKSGDKGKFVVLKRKDV